MTVYPSPWMATPKSNTKDITTIGVIEAADEVDEAMKALKTESMEMVDNKPTADPRTNHILCVRRPKLYELLMPKKEVWIQVIC